MGRLRTNPSAINEIKNYSYYLENNKSKKYFNNSNPINLEIGMGKGLFIMNNALTYPSINFIGVEKYPTVILKAFKKFDNLEHKLTNLKVISVDACNLLDWFNKHSINKIYLNFSDPWPKRKHEPKRLTSNNFLEIYKTLLIKNGEIEFKTDNSGLYSYTLDQLSKSIDFEVLYFTNDLYNDQNAASNNIPTEYEIKFRDQGIKIKKIVAKLIK